MFLIISTGLILNLCTINYIEKSVYWSDNAANLNRYNIMFNGSKQYVRVDEPDYKLIKSKLINPKKTLKCGQ